MTHTNCFQNNINQTYQYNFITDDDDNKQIGFLAQDMREIFPDCVQGNDTDLEEYKQPLTIDYSRITPLLYSALKQSITEIEILKNTINDLIDEINTLKSEINYIKDILFLNNFLNIYFAYHLFFYLYDNLILN